MNKTLISSKRGVLIVACLLLSLPGLAWAKPKPCPQYRVELGAGSQAASIALPECAKVKVSADAISVEQQGNNSRQDASGNVSVEIRLPGASKKPIVLRTDAAAIVITQAGPGPK